MPALILPLVLGCLASVCTNRCELARGVPDPPAPSTSLTQLRKLAAISAVLAASINPSGKFVRLELDRPNDFHNPQEHALHPLYLEEQHFRAQASMGTRVQDGLQNKMINPTASAWPCLLHKYGKFNNGDPFKGLFRHEGLTKCVCKYVFLGPSSVAAAVRSRSTRKSNADIHSMITINAAVIVYCCVLFRWAIDSQCNWSSTDTAGSFPYMAFYNNLIAYLTPAAGPREHIKSHDLEKDIWSKDRRPNSRPRQERTTKTIAWPPFSSSTLMRAKLKAINLQSKEPRGTEHRISYSRAH
ncbi:hypothetical protein SISSUDRAFT_1067408 [Sistotremastrum suecicum HHB10207 ss-3]|uniref:Uncharacterized protein n=1 Tax=Sistotremastrum suecicum HHB10207 ss-3 TaxID=1314776 RepID=A0A165X5Q9_9AGAM|nr:hypothetical protein SISSUDRAFT_1067408 [Sistotremastrum suecicum HHB10207 ss-3]